MSDKDPVGTEADGALWARLKTGTPANDPARVAAITEQDLAAWLDGRLSPDAAARVEARLAADPAMLNRALDAASALREATPPASERLVARAQALVGFEVERLPRAAGGLWAWLAGWRRPIEVAVVTGAFLLVCITGFSLGGGFQEAFANDGAEITDFVTAPLAGTDLGFLVEQGSQP
ncbi:anti-sigma factor [Reyranella sp. CPCC 100927]|uniref:anti-sigma factor family protein n=1 Tax=Reyranella sp. CPCC 100927 TaxID=2599616 RepID=UPI0011B6DC1C|nr:hypothetical protein [Reyranella sp. CPCC 100927]TWT05629.1 hypothetical protein FQU96_24265 [Reyranella sp. CPCC 100927]